jgi:HAD superfamily hydrolase (TIGR01484 family)
VSIRLVATDLDGTLWDRTVTARPEVRAAVDELHRRGIIVLAATGRRPRSARTALADNGLSVPAVCLDGTFGEDFIRGERFHESLFSPADALAVLELFVTHDVGPNVFVDHAAIDVLLGTVPSHRPERAESLLDWAHVGPLHDSVPQHRVAAFTVIGGAFEVLAPVAAAVTATGLARATLTSDSLYGGTSLSVIPAAASKWAGVAAFAAAAGIDPAEVLGVGDAANDVELLQGAGYAVAVRDGAPEVLAEADELIDGPGDGGWVALVDICTARG